MKQLKKTLLYIKPTTHTTFNVGSRRKWVKKSIHTKGAMWQRKTRSV